MSDRCDSALAPLGELDPDLKTPRPTVRDMPTDWKRPRPRRQYASEAELQRQATAYHEASHLVVGLIMDLEPMRITIEADGHVLGRCHFHQMWAPSVLRQWVINGGLLAVNARVFIERCMVMSLAGMVGQRLFEPASGHPRSWGDDENHAWELATLVMDTEWQVEMALYFAKKTATRLLRRKASWCAVEKVANALLVQTTLEGEDLNALVYGDDGIYDMLSRSRFEMGHQLAKYFYALVPPAPRAQASG